MRGRGALLAVAATLVAALAGPAGAAWGADGSSTAEGRDVSFPQCGSTPPPRDDLAVVGVNGGTGTTTNPCLAAQLAWGDAADGSGAARRADVYVNTADPGHLAGWWPSDGRARDGSAVRVPGGTCRGAEDVPCAYVYGWSIALDDLRRGVPAAEARTWWLDVETSNSWSWDRAANRAVLEGMTDALRSRGLRVGLYATARQWSSIVGRVPGSSTLAGLPAWLAGSTSRGGAAAACRSEPLVPHGRIRLSQWVADGVDRDLSCEAGVTGTRPRVVGDPVVGGRLEADPGAWGPGGTTLSVQWLRDGRPVGAADASGWTPTAADAGSAIAVRVTGSRPGQPDLALTSAAVRIAPAVAPPATVAPATGPATAPPSASPWAPASAPVPSSPGT